MNGCFTRRLRYFASLAFVTAVTVTASPAFAGKAAQTQLDRNLQSMTDKVIAVLQGPLVIGVATIFFMGALLMMLMGAGGDGVQKLVKIVLVIAAMLAAPGILMNAWTAMGGLI